MSYIGASSEYAYASQDIYWYNVTKYVNSPDPWTWANVGSVSNSGTVDTPAALHAGPDFFTSKVGEAMPVSPFTSVGTHPVGLAWDGASFPDFSSYGADHN
jgi:hypothetical protein